MPPVSAAQQAVFNVGTAVGLLAQQALVEPKPLRQFLDALQYPLSFMDFKSCSSSSPMFDGTWPFCQVPVQFIVHVQSVRGADATHVEFLAESDSDSREAFIEAPLSALPPMGDILVYHVPFERARLRELAGAFPHYASAIDAVIDRCMDLIVPFKQGWHYDPEMGASNSIKAVLRALVPELQSDGDRRWRDRRPTDRARADV